MFKQSKTSYILALTSLLLVMNTSIANNLPNFAQLVEEHSSAVVNISTTQKPQNVHSGLPPNLQQIPENSQYEDLLKHFFGAPGQQRSPQRQSHSLGSGFVISEDGYILTNHHVVRNAEEIIVRFQDRRELQATLIGSDGRTDVALLKVEAKGLPVLKFGSSKNLKVGEWVFAIGSPFGFDSSVTAGIVSAKGRSLPQENYVPFIQTDVAINPGNSGGPLFNLKGEVVGINSQIYSRSGGFMGLSFAIPIDVAMNVSNQLKKSGHVVRGWLGVRIQDVTRELAESFDMNKPHGALIAQVVSNSPAEKAGLLTGDIIIEFNGEIVNKSSSLPPLVGSANISEKARVKVIRNKKTKMINVKLENLPDDKLAQSESLAPVEKKSNSLLGMSVMDLTNEMRDQFNVKRFGVLVKLTGKGAGERAGVRQGDLIMQFDGVDVKNVKHLSLLVKKAGNSKFVPVLINRQGNPIFLALKK